MADYLISQLTEDESADDSDLLEVAKSNGDGTYTSRKQQRSTLLSGKANQSDLDAHEADTANPHSVTAAQVGAPSSAAFTAHTGDTSNPHSVTKAQVGLSNVDNTADLSKPVSTATQSALDGKSDTGHTHDERYYTESEVDIALADKAEAGDLSANESDTANPHLVTAEQVGLGNVDNTSDLAKPVSTATQTALDSKSDGGHTHDDRYYTESEVDTALSGKADTSHTHDIADTTGLQDALDAKADDTDLPNTIVESVIAGSNVTIDNTDPANPVVSASGGGGGGGAVDSVNGATGEVVLDADDISDDATTHKFATASQLANADSAVQPGDLATVATTASYFDLTDAPAVPETFDDLDDGSTYRAFTDDEKTKLSGIATGATANDNDANLRDRSTHTGTQTASTISNFDTEVDGRIDAAAGVSIASLVDGKVPTAQIPAVALVNVHTAEDETEMLSLTVQQGDVVVRTDEQKTYMHNGDSTGTISDFIFLQTPADSVASVNGQTGTVVLDKSDVGLGNVDSTSDANKPVSTATQSALDDKADDADLTSHTADTSIHHPITVGTTEPGSPSSGDLWVDTN